MNSPNPRPRPFDEQLPHEESGASAEHEQFPAAQLHASPPLHDTSGEPQYAADAPPLHEYGGQADGHEQPDNYDPVWTGQGEVTERSAAVTQADLDRIEEILSSEHFRIRRKRADRSDFVPPPPPPAPAKKANALAWAAGTFALLVAASAFIAYQATDRGPLLNGASDAGGVMSRVASLLGPQQQEQPPQAAAPAPLPTRAAPPTPPPAIKPHLVVTGASADSHDRILVGVSADGADGMNAVIGGLVPGTTLTAGKPWGATGWIVPAAELATTYLRPPAGFSGAMEYSVALHRPDNSVIDRQTMRLEWNPQTAATPPQQESPAQPQQAEPVQAQQPQSPQPAPQAGPPQQAARGLPREEVDAMLKKGESLMMEGDIASARLLLQRAADAQDARAAFALAATYDPIELKRLGVYGAVPDVGRARDWYEKAKLYGSREAPRRLELLASQFR